ncbi:nuclear transport factor 2 family protein [Streptomyces sp. AC512_CC834]|uniref:nuclear transport factor 2 family protein n=1 Tax=Streptomyces sp. AC512_CC834 TaxID=2823691 RepID=UPI001C27DD52|nr:nuclear transport factor 2 family protein [Streptomyces sp. AC512_CC834]
MHAPQRSTRRVDAQLYVEVLQFYARQMPLLEERRLEEFLETMTEDGSIEHVPNGWRIEGRNALLTEMRARRGDPDRPLVGEMSARQARADEVAYYDGIVYRYWFDRMRIEPQSDDVLRVGYQAMVSMTDAAGKVSFEPTTTVQDVLVRQDGEWYTRSRRVTHDSPNWADKIHNPS